MKKLVEYLWDCPSCGKKRVLGRFTSCTDLDGGGCGASVPSNAVYYEPPPGAIEVQGEQRRDALAGENWRCPFCEGMARTKEGRCARCGGGARPTSPVVTAAVATLFAYHTRETPKPFPIKFVGGALTAVLLLVTLVWGCTEHDYPGKVAGKDWTRSVTIETWGRTTQSGWREHDNLRHVAHVDPVGGRGERAGMENIRSCSRQVHHTVQVLVGTHQECSSAALWVNIGGEIVELVVSPSHAQSLGNGYGYQSSPSGGSSYSGGGGYSAPAAPSVPVCRTVNDYRDDPVYDDRCQYDTWTWADGATKTRSGAGEEVPAWPEVAHHPDTQRLRRAETYVVRFEYSGDTHAADMDLDAFLRWRVGQSATVTANNFGYVSSVRP